MRIRCLTPLLVVALSLTACDTQQLEPAGTEYARVLAVGNSITAGFMNNGLRYEGQLAGFPNLVATSILGGHQSDVTETAALQMPLVRGAAQGGMGVSSTIGPGGILLGTLYISPTEGLTQDPYPAGTGPRDLLLNLLTVAPYENLGVPGATTQDFFTATSSANSQIPGNVFFDAILRNELLSGPAFPDDRWQTQLDQLQELAASPYNGNKELLMLWIGNNDVLGGTLSGNPVLGVNVVPTSFYEQMMQTIAPAIVAAGYPQVALFNIPNVTRIPYVTTIPLIPDPQNFPGVTWNTDEANVMFVLLPAQPLLLNPNGTPNLDYLPGGGSSLPSSLTLTADEVALLQQEVAGYNGVLANLADDRGWALVDVNAAFASLPPDPSQINGLFPFLPTVLPPPGQNVNSVFSLDGVHPSEKGHALLANLVIDAVGETYGTTYFKYDITQVQNRLGFEALLPARSAMPRSVMSRQAAAGLSGLARFLGGS